MQKVMDPGPGTLESPTSARAATLLWVAVLAPPAAWFLGLMADYGLVQLACSQRTMLPLHLATLVTLALAVCGGWIGTMEWKRAGLEWPDEGASPHSRTRFMAALSLMGSALFSLVILAQWATKLFLNPCMGT